MSTTTYVSNAGIQSIEKSLKSGETRRAAYAVKQYVPSVLVCLALLGTAISFGAIAETMATKDDFLAILSLYEINQSFPEDLALLPYIAPTLALFALAIAVWRCACNIAANFNTNVAASKPSRLFNIAVAVSIIAITSSFAIHIIGAFLSQFYTYVPTTVNEADIMKYLRNFFKLEILLLLLALTGGFIAALKACAGTIKTTAATILTTIKWSIIFICSAIAAPFVFVIALILLVIALSLATGVAGLVLFIALLPTLLSVCRAATR